MQDERSIRPDWRDGAAYRPLLEADRSLIAWEWLRRDPHYQEAAAHAEHSMCGAAGADEFGLVLFESPHLTVPNARPVWSASVNPYVLSTGLGRNGGPADEFDAGQAGIMSRIVRSVGDDHLLLSDGLRAIRLDGPPGTFSNGPVRLDYRIGGIVSAAPSLLTLRRFLAFARTGRFARSLHRPEARARRWILLLRTADALAAGASQREIAAVLLNPGVRERHWRTAQSSLRSQAQRLARSARLFAVRDYRRLLD